MALFSLLLICKYLFNKIYVVSETCVMPAPDFLISHYVLTIYNGVRVNLDGIMSLQQQYTWIY